MTCLQVIVGGMVTLLATFWLYIALIVSLMMNPGVFTNGCPSDKPAEIQGVARFNLPPSATNLESYCSGLQGWGADARFEMSPDDLPIFIGSVWIKTELSSDSQPHYITNKGYFSFDVPFDEMTSYLHSYEESGDDLRQEILIDTSNPERYTVYLLILAG